MISLSFDQLCDEILVAQSKYASRAFVWQKQKAKRQARENLKRLNSMSALQLWFLPWRRSEDFPYRNLGLKWAVPNT